MDAASPSSTLPAREPAAEAAAPPVVAVVVTCNPGWWLEDCIRSLAAQDYPTLSVLVVDADSAEDPTGRVGAVMPGAFVRRVRRRRGFGAAANEVLETVEGASHYVFCHDDVVLAPDAIRYLVEEAYRTNAGVVAPKLVGWFAPDRLIATGMGADRFGVPVALVERGELDQEQHDAVRDVFFAPSACVLVRADLFATLGGFDAAYGPVGEDLDLAWRAHLAGARVVFSPGAKVRHLEATEGGQRAIDGELRASGPDAEARAESVGLAHAVFDVAEQPDAGGPGAGGPGAGGPGAGGPDAGGPDAGGPDAGVAGAGSEGGVDEGGAPGGPSRSPAGALGDGTDLSGAPAALATPPADEVVWDLGRWDEEEAAEIVDAAAAAAAARHAGHHASWRARRDAERTTAADTWTGDDDDWEVDSWSARRRSRRVAAARVRQADRAAAASRSGWAGMRRSERDDVAVRGRGPDADVLDERRAEARLRAVATNYSQSRLLTRLPLLLALTVVEAAVRLVRRGPEEARRALRPWGALIRQSGAVRVRRRVVRKTRTVPDHDITALQVTGTARVRHALRTAAAPGPAPVLAGAGHGRRLAVVVWTGAVVFLAFGSRSLLSGHLPTIGELAPWPSASTALRYFGSGWRTSGLGSAAAAPTVFGLVGVAGTIVLGHTTFLQHVLVVGMIPLGALGAARLARGLPSRRAPLVGLIAYLAVPLPYNAMATGRWSGLVAYGATPWLVGLLVRATDVGPFGLAGPTAGATGSARATESAGATGSDGAPRTAEARPRPPLSPVTRVVGVGVVSALVAAVAPGYLVVVVVTGVALLAGLLLATGRPTGGRAAVAALGGSVVAAILLAPWSTGWRSWVMFAGASPAALYAAHLGTLLRFETGPIGAAPVGYALLVAAALPLAIGRGWRSTWAPALWAVALSSWAMAWAGQHRALGLGWPGADVALAPAAVAVAMLVALGMAAFDFDLPGSTFGWRQVVSAAAAVALGAACIPVLAAAGGGRWRQPSAGYETVLSWMPPKQADGDFRVLWLGSPDALPVPGWPLDPTTAYATTRNGPPQFTDGWPAADTGPTHALADAVSLARRDQTTDLGHLLAPMGVRYIAVVEHADPLEQGARHWRPAPADIHDGIESQLDVHLVDRSDALTIYQNDAWAPMRIRLPDGAVAAAESGDPHAARGAVLAGAPAVLQTSSGATSFSGPVAASSTILADDAPSARWTLTVGGQRASRQRAFGVANLFTTDGGGQGTLRYRTPAGWRLAEALEAVAWLAALAVLIRGRRRVARRPAAVAG